MDTPICDFVRAYTAADPLRLHVPGHKGTEYLGMERLDITEIDGADSLYEASGIIARSEENASRLFGCPTFYSTEGSSHCIRAMLYLAGMEARKMGKKPVIAAARNVHKSFLSAVALLDYDVVWLYPQESESYLSCKVTPQALEELLAEKPAEAVYITSPDYLGGLSDISALAETAHRYGCLLLVDNAHGAYLHFLSQSAHPIALGADLCCDSAHKTLPVLTGGAYLHTAKGSSLAEQVKNALALFGSTSPSYLILQSLDMTNALLAGDHPRKLCAFAEKVAELKKRLTAHGFRLHGDEPLKLTISTKPCGYAGKAFAQILQENNVFCEFVDPDFAVMMLTPELGEQGLKRLEEVLLSVPQKAVILEKPPVFRKAEKVMSVREAVLAPCEQIPVTESAGRVLALASVGCPPAVPILVCGERIDENAISCFSYYGTETCTVVKE